MRYRFGGFELDEPERLLRKGGVPVEIGDRAFDLLIAFAKEPNHLISKDVLMDVAWPNLFVSENNLQVQVSGLRRILGREALTTVAGRGYRFNLPVEALERSAPAAEAAPSSPAARVANAQLFGRDDDISRIHVLLAESSLVTVTGSGGIGKTSVADAVAAGLRDRGEAVAWLDLSPLTDASLIPSLLAQACGFSESIAEGGVQKVVAAVAAKRWFIVLDNAEHLLEPVATLAAAIAKGAPDARILATSQARLRLPHEQVHRLEGLQTPPAGADAADILSFSAPALFVSRARALNRDFEVTAANADAIVAICRRLDGMPLALELAAGRLPLFGVDGLERRLDQRLQILGGGYRTSMTRQQTLQAVFEWSYGLMPESERTLFRRLGVFAGPFSLEWACIFEDQPGAWNTVEALGNLLDRSMIEIVDDDIPTYRLSETGRAFALQMLLEQKDRATLERAARLYEAEGALAHARAAELDAIRCYSTAIDLQRHLEDLGDGRERRLSLLLKLGPAVQTALSPANPRCSQIYVEALELARSIGSPTDTFHALWGHWQYLCMVGNVRDAGALADELATMAPSLGDSGLELEAWHATFSTQLLLGNAPAVVEASNRALAIYDRDRHQHLSDEFGGHDAGICALGQSALALWLGGRLGEARAAADAAVVQAANTKHPYSSAVGYYYGALAFHALRMSDAFAGCASMLRAVSDRHGMAILRTEGDLFAGRAEFDAGRRAAGISAMQSAYRLIVDSGDTGFALLYAAMMAEALIASGHAVGAASLIDEAMEFARDGQGLFLSELHRLRAKILSAAGNSEAARSDLRQAMAIAREQHAVMLELRAALDLSAISPNDATPRIAELLVRVEDRPDAPEVVAAKNMLGAAGN